MRLAAKHGAYMVFLCSGASSSKELEQLAALVPSLRWIAIAGPLPQHESTENRNITALFASSGDLAQKRNFGLTLARLLGWEAILFCDDDVKLSEAALLRHTDLLGSGAVLVSSNARDFADHSVVVGAYREVYGYSQVDSFLSGSSLSVRVSDTIQSYCPDIYNEDWFFMMPYVLKYGPAAWVGSVAQEPYNQYIPKRAESEEAGDVLAEGLLRLTMAIVADHKDEPLDELLDLLADRASKAYWQREIMQRAVMIRDLLHQTRWPGLRKKGVRVRRALKAAMHVLVGDVQSDGLDPTALEAWVRGWTEEIKRLNQTPHSARIFTLEKALQELGIVDQAQWQDPQTGSKNLLWHLDIGEDSMPKLPPATRTLDELKGLHATWILSRYMQSKRLSMRSVAEIGDQLRYDRPINWLSGNKAVATVVVAVRVHEEPELIARNLKQINAWNPRAIPINCVVWLVDSEHRDHYAETYRDYLMARLMLETVGTNLRLLSGFGKATEPLVVLDEVVHTLGLFYWMGAIESIGHSVTVMNAKNEILGRGTLAELILGRKPETGGSFETVLANAPTPSDSQGVHEREDLRAAESARRRLLRHYALPRGLKRVKTQLRNPSRRLEAALKRGGLSWVEVDDLSHTARAYDPIGLYVLHDVRLIEVIDVRAGTAPVAVRAQVNIALQRLTRKRRRVGTRVEIMVVVTGAEPRQQLLEYRDRVIADILARIDLPPGVVLASILAGPTSGLAKSERAQIEAEVLYLHWLENNSVSPRLAWVGI